MGFLDTIKRRKEGTPITTSAYDAIIVDEEPMVIEEVIESKKEVNPSYRIIKEIHDSFDNANDEEIAKVKELVDSLKVVVFEMDLEERAKKLIKAGFINHDIVKQYNDLEIKKSKRDATLKQAQETLDLYKYFKVSYPSLKFLTEERLDEICKKYGLVYAPVKNYKGEVPEKNLDEILNAQDLKDGDAVEHKYFLEYSSRRDHYEKTDLYGRLIPISEPEIIRTAMGTVINYDSKELEKYLVEHNLKYISNDFARFEFELHTVKIDGLFICAPKDEFNTNGLKEYGLGHFESTVTSPIKGDPIVFRYVRGGVQVLSKWGLEGLDPELQLGIEN